MAFEVNFNEAVEVELTEFGASILKAKRDELNTKIRNNGGNGVDPVGFKEGDKYKDQIWSLMKDFGPYMGFAYPEPFKGDMTFPTGRKIPEGTKRYVAYGYYGFYPNGGVSDIIGYFDNEKEFNKLCKDLKSDLNSELDEYQISDTEKDKTYIFDSFKSFKGWGIKL